MKNVGGICILSFTDISDIAFGELFRFNDELGRSDRRTVERIVGDMIDDFMTRNMIWTKRKADVEPRYYIDKFGDLMNNYPRKENLIIEIEDSISELIGEVLQLPTWHVVYVHVSGTSVELELGTDYRIDDWMEKFGDEYDDKPRKLAW